jgi:hypothetical protein
MVSRRRCRAPVRMGEPPLWFETKVSRSAADGNALAVKIEQGTLRYSTMADALAGYLVIREKVRSGEIGE